MNQAKPTATSETYKYVYGHGMDGIDGYEMIMSEHDDGYEKWLERREFVSRNMVASSIKNGKYTQDNQLTKLKPTCLDFCDGMDDFYYNVDIHEGKIQHDGY